MNGFVTMFARSCLVCAVFSLAALLIGAIARKPEICQPAAAATGVFLALGLRSAATLRGYQFTAWIVAAVVAALVYPSAVLGAGHVDLKNKWLILAMVQLVMFGMGTQMRLKDFLGLGRMSYGVFVGLSLQFTMMPLTGYFLARAIGFPDEIAAGIVLIGSCSSGLASNVMTYLARANLPLSITVTAASTLIAPIMTPFWMNLLAGKLVQVRFVDMMLDIVKIVIVPIGAALLHDVLQQSSPRGRRVVLAFASIGIVWLIALALGCGEWMATRLPDGSRDVYDMAAFISGAVVVGVAYHGLTFAAPQLPRFMPLASMAGIIFFTAVTTAAGRDALLSIGWLLLLAVIAHNAIGYVLGYWLSRALGLDKNSARTVALEVGLQNGGMATGLANAMGKLGTVGLAAAVFSPWMNVSGSILANYWRRNPPASQSLLQEPGDG